MELRMDAEGRLLLPADLLQELGWTPGTALEVERAEGGLRLRTAARPAEKAPAAPSPYGSSTPAGVDTASLKEEARQLADSMRHLTRPAEISTPVTPAPPAPA